jgi:SAM-dependent methyltransferase
MSTLKSLLRRVVRQLRRPLGGPPSADPSGPLIESARSIAFIVDSTSDAKGQAWFDAAKARGAEIDMLPLFQPYRRDDERTMSFLLAPPRARYDCVVVHPATEFYEHSWSYAFLDRLNGFLGENGTLFIPRRDDTARRISDARLKALFGAEPRQSTKRFLAFRKAQGGLTRPAEAATSVLDAYFPIRDVLIQGRFDVKLADTIRALGVRRARLRIANRADSFLVQLKSQSYRTCSAATKSALVQYLAAQYFPGRGDLRVVDLGAGTGLNALELLLNQSGVAHVTLVEPNRAYHWSIAQMVEQLGERVRGKVALSDQRVEEYSGTPADIAVVCHVFSVMPVEGREPFVQSAWRNVAPGGILAVLENMQISDPALGGAYNATRLTTEEIDAMLGRFGRVRYFRSDALEEIAAGAVGNKPVFRVVHKPA